MSEAGEAERRWPPIEDSEQSPEGHEQVEVAPYEEYRAFCDLVCDGFRHTGLLNAEEYEAATRDSRTILCTIDGKTLPALTPVDYEVRYDAQRIKEMTEKDEVMLLTIPHQKVGEALFSFSQIVAGEEARGDFAILVEEFQDDRHARSDRDELARQFALFGELTPHDFNDPRLEDEEHKTAWMALYDFSFRNKEPVSQEVLELPPVEALVRAWDEVRGEKNLPPIPDETSNGAYLFTAEQLQENQKIVDDLWSISEVGFGGVLGKYHPISMEVTKGFFEEHITSDEVLTAVRYVKGEPVCFGFLAPNMKLNDWLDCESSILKQDLENAEDKSQQVAHFFELISKSSAGLALSSSIINLFLDLASRSRNDWHVIFESTNLSDTYIPKIAETLVQRSPKVELTEDVEKISRLNYWYLKK